MPRGVDLFKMVMGDCWLGFRGDDPVDQGLTQVNRFDWSLKTWGVTDFFDSSRFSKFWWTKSWLWSVHEVFLLSPKSCANPWSESGDRELDLLG
jgi:hypothetical protein